MAWKKISDDQTPVRKHGYCSLAVEDGRLIIVFPRSLFGGKQKTMALNLPDTAKNRKAAFLILDKIQRDISFDDFDFTLERYRRQSLRQDYIKKVTEIYPEITLLSLWQKYLEYKKPSIKESTLYYLQSSVTAYLEKAAISSPYQALELREKLLKITTESMTKRVLTYVNAAFEWGLKHKLIKGVNPYDGMASELKHHYQIETIPNAFTEEEKQAVIEAFTGHKGNWNGKKFVGRTYRHYTDFVRFLFLTGCRPSEAIGLRWGNVSQDFKKVIFNGSIYQLGNGKLIETKGSKNNKRREFPCNSELQELLESRKLPDAQDSDLVFPSPTGKAIAYGNFCKNAWDKVVDPIKAGTTPYSCRDTFISEQIAKGVNPAIVAKWVDNSTQIIEKHYLDSSAISHILPQ